MGNIVRNSLLVALAALHPFFASAAASTPEKPQLPSEVSGERKASPSRRSKVSKVKRKKYSHRKLGVGVELGSNATYGNGVRADFEPVRYLSTEFGLGYNTTGFKAGMGILGLAPIGRFKFGVGVAFAYSGGNSGKVSVEGQFTPDGGSTEKITASRRYRMSSGQYASAGILGAFEFIPALWGHLRGSYNKLLRGHEVEFTGETSFDTPVEVTNEREMDEEFTVKAKEQMNITGFGVSVGVTYRF